MENLILPTLFSLVIFAIIAILTFMKYRNFSVWGFGIGLALLIFTVYPTDEMLSNSKLLWFMNFLGGLAAGLTYLFFTKRISQL